MNSFFSYFKSHPSVAIIIVIALTITEVHLNLKRYNHHNVLKWDIVGYYSYLQAACIDKDLTLSFIKKNNETNYQGVRYVYSTNEKGNHIIKYSMGMAMLYAPFFFTAHLLSSPLGFPADGFSPIYQCLIEFSGLFYVLIGFWYLRKVGLLFYSEKTVALSLLFIFFGTNLLCYSTVDGAMSHAYTFSLFSVFIFFTIRYFNTYHWKYMLFMGLLFGLMVLVRPINILFIMVVFLIGVSSVKEFKQRCDGFIRNYPHVMLFMACSFLVILPQLLYWKMVTGNYLVFSYDKEGFYFNHPHLIDGLVSFRKGWLIYSPLIAFSLMGIWVLRKHNHSGFYLTILLLLPLYYYTVSSWWCWWYGGSYSLRAMIDLYPLMAISLAAFIKKIQEVGRLKRSMSYGILTVLLVLNIIQTFQYKWNIIHYDAMTYKAYKHVFLTLDSDQIDTTLLYYPNYEKALLGLPE